MTTTPTDIAGSTPTNLVLRRSDPGGGEVPSRAAEAGGSELGFGDLLDVINPLQHIPIVSTIYRELTGDTISDAARMAGGVLYGGPFGLVGALANTIVEAETGKDIGGNTMAWLSGGEPGDTAGETAVAVATPAAPEPTAAAPVVVIPTTVAAATSDAGMASAGPAAGAASIAAAETPAKSAASFNGRAADRLDAFIRNAGAVRRPAPLPGAVDPVRLQAEAMTPPTLPTKPKDERHGSDETLMAADGNTTVSDWMLRALDKYEHMRRQETS